MLICTFCTSMLFAVTKSLKCFCRYDSAPVPTGESYDAPTQTPSALERGSSPLQGVSKRVSCYTLVDNFGKYGPISIILSQGSAATEFRCGGIFYFTAFRSLSTNPKVKEWLKSARICQSYPPTYNSLLFWPTLYILFPLDCFGVYPFLAPSASSLWHLKRRNVQYRAFALLAGPRACNSLPEFVTDCSSPLTFKK